MIRKILIALLFSTPAFAQINLCNSGINLFVSEGSTFHVNGDYTHNPHNGTSGAVDNQGIIEIYGNIDNQADSGVFIGDGVVKFLGDSTHLITGNPVAFKNLEIENSNNQDTIVSLETNITICDTMNLASGIINADGNSIQIGVNASNPGVVTNGLGWMVGGKFVRYIPINTIADSSQEGLFPLGNPTSYRPLYLSISEVPTTDGFLCVEYNDIIGNTFVDFSDGMDSIIERTNLNYSVISSGLSDGVYGLSSNPNDLPGVTDLNELRMVSQDTAYGLSDNNSGDITSPYIRRIDLTLSELNNSYYIGWINPNPGDYQVTATTDEDVSLIVKIESPGDSVDIVSIISGPSNGGVSGLNDGDTSFTYSPNPDFNGMDTVVVLLCDRFSNCDTANVYMTVNPIADPPVISGEPGSVGQSLSNTINVAANDTDPDGDINLGSLTVLSGPNAVGATATSDGAGSLVVDYLGAPTFVGSDTIVYELCDNTSPTPLCGSDTLFLTVTAGSAPTTTGDVATVDEDDPVTNINVLANDSDPEGNLDTTSVTIVFGPTGNGSNTVVDASGNIDYTPGSNFNGTDTIVYQVCDYSMICSTDTLFVTVNSVDDAPIIIGEPGGVGQGLVSNINVSLNDSDPDGNLDLSSLVVLSGPNAVGATAIPDGSGSLVVDYSGAPSFIGTDTIVYQICDNTNPTPLCGSDTLFLTVSVGAQPVTVSDFITIDEDDPTTNVNVASNDSDPDGNLDSTSVSILIGPSGVGSVAVVDGIGGIDFTVGPNFNGADTVIYQICDSTGLCSSDSLFVTVNSVADAPIIVGEPGSVGQSLSNTINVSANDTDPDDDINLASLTVLTGPNAAGATATPDGLGNLIVDYSGAPTFVGNDTIVYEICDNTSPTPLCGTDTLFLSVTVGSAPTTTGDVATVDEDDPVTNINVLANDTDPEGNLDTTSVTIAYGPTGTGSNATVDVSGNIDYTPGSNFNGIDTIVYQVCDYSMICSTDTLFVTINSIPDAPIIVGEPGSVGQSLSNTINVSANDTDPDDDINLASLTVLSGPNAGGATAISDGSGNLVVDYSGAPTFVGNDTIVYEICDNTSPTPLCGSDTLFLSVTVGSAPTTTGDVATVDEDDPITNINVLANDTDPEGNLDTTSVTIAYGPTGTGSNATVDVSGNIDYTPGSNFNGIDTIVYQVCDYSLICSTDTLFVTVNSIPDAPIILGEPGNVDQGLSSTINVSANDTDPDDDINLASLTVVSGPNASGATATSNGLGSLILDYSGAPTFVGNDTIVYEICDNTSPIPLCVSDTLFVSVAPTGNVGPQVIDGGGAPIDTVTATTNEDTAIDVFFNAVDPNGDPIDVTGVLSGPNNGTVTGLGSGDTTITYTPSNNFNGIDTLQALVCDAFNVCDTVGVIITVNPVNDPPVITDGGGTPIDTTMVTTTVDTPVQVCLNTIDPEGDLTDVTALSCSPSNGTISGLNDNDLCLTYSPNVGFTGIDQVCALVCDLSGACDTITIDITINAVNNPPMVVDAGGTPVDTVPLSVTQNTLNILCVNAIDTDGNNIEVSSVLTGPNNGLIGGLGDGDLCIDYTPNLGFNGIDTVQVLVCDDGTPTTCDTTVLLLVIGSNTSPTAIDDNVNISGATNINVLFNDSDIDGNLDPTSVVIVSSPSNGVATVNLDGSIYYIPNSGFTGNDTITYQVCDNHSVPFCSTAKVYITVTDPDESGITISNFVTPNGDGFNDVFIIRGIENYPDNEVVIFNRWGNNVYVQKGYNSNDESKSWRGISNRGLRIGNEVPDGTYFYVIKLNDDDDQNFSGYIELRK